MSLRRARATDAPAIAVLERLATKTAMPWLPDLHKPEEDLAFIRDQVLMDDEVWVIEADEALAAYIALKPGLIDHLAVHPAHWRGGLGARLVGHAQTRQAALDLWTFQRNAPARALYEKHGFQPAEFTDGARNEEKEPDVRYTWRKEDAAP
ncbi:MAG: GNAT family N-acetyltransferase [Pseudomonadota bacterium]